MVASHRNGTNRGPLHKRNATLDVSLERCVLRGKPATTLSFRELMIRNRAGDIARRYHRAYYVHSLISFFFTRNRYSPMRASQYRRTSLPSSAHWSFEMNIVFGASVGFSAKRNVAWERTTRPDAVWGDVVFMERGRRAMIDNCDFFASRTTDSRYLRAIGISARQSVRYNGTVPTPNVIGVALRGIRHPCQYSELHFELN